MSHYLLLCLFLIYFYLLSYHFMCFKHSKLFFDAINVTFKFLASIFWVNATNVIHVNPLFMRVCAYVVLRDANTLSKNIQSWQWFTAPAGCVLCGDLKGGNPMGFSNLRSPALKGNVHPLGPQLATPGGEYDHPQTRRPLTCCA